MKMQIPTLPKFGISAFGNLWCGKMRKSLLTASKKCKIGISKFEIRFRFWILLSGNWFLKFENRFHQFLSNIISRPQNSNSARSKTPKSTFSHQNSHFRFKFFFDQNLDFVLGHPRAVLYFVVWLCVIFYLRTVAVSVLALFAQHVLRDDFSVCRISGADFLHGVRGCT